MTSSDDLGALIDQVRDGSDAASRELVARYGTHILRVVRHLLNKELRPRYDSQDFVQAVWASFFALLPEQGEFAQPEELTAFLGALARNKVIEAVRERFQCHKSSVNRECPLPAAMESPLLDPVAIAIAREEWQRLLIQYQPPERRILEMLRTGHGRHEVAAELGVSEKTVHRVIRKLSPRAAHAAD